MGPRHSYVRGAILDTQVYSAQVDMSKRNGPFRRFGPLAAGLASLVVLALALPACGSDDETAGTEGSGAARPGTTTEASDPSAGANGGAADQSGDGSPRAAISGSAFLKEANAICARAGQEIIGPLTAPPADLAGKSETEIYETLADSVFIPAVERELSELEHLDPAPGDRAQFERILAAMSEGLEEVKVRQVTSLAEFGEPFVEYDDLVADFGIRSCRFKFA
jgi:hypothetical protein